MQHPFRLRASAAALFSLCYLLPAAADESPKELDQLVVTAGLEPISLGDVASSVTVITREEIEQRQVKYLGDLLRQVAGFAVSQSGGPGTLTQVRVRGAEANHLLVLMDGVRANDPASADEFQYQYALTANIERIEIIRGPQSATWGTDALAGVINIIRRKEVHDQHIALSAEYGSFDTINLGVDGGIRRGRAQLSAGLAYLDTDGSNISRQGDERDGAENTNLNAALDFAASDAWRLLFSAQHVDSTTAFDDFDYALTGLPVDADRVTEAERNYLRAEVQYQPDEARLSGGFSVNWMDSENENISDGVFNSSTAAETLELRFKSSVLLGDQAAKAHRLTFLLEHDEVDFSQRGIASPFGDPNQQQDYEATSYAAEYVGNPFTGLNWTLSGRLDDFSDFDQAKTWQLAVSQRISPALRVRGSVGTGSKAPTFTERFGFYPDFFLGNPLLKPETSKGWELGFELQSANEDYRLGVAYFSQTLEDEIDGFVFDLDTFFFTAQNKTNDSKRKGLELVLDGNLSDALSFSASYTYVDAHERDATGQPFREARRPRHLANLNANYRFAAEKANANLNINYNGTQLDNFFPPPFFAQQQVELDGFVVVDLALSWQLTDRLQLVGRVNNLLDEDYEEVLGFARPGRALYAGLRGRFAR